LKQTLKIGAMLLVVAALATTGVAIAQSGNEATTTTTEATTLRAKIVEWLAPLVDEGTIDQSQAEAVADTLAASLPGFPGGRMDRGLEAVREAADFLGLTPEEVAVAVRDGQTLAEIAVAQGQTAEALIAHLSTLAGEHLNQLVADGRITEEQQADMLANMTDRITDLVNGQIDRPMMGGPGMGRPRGMGGDGPCMGGDTDLEELGA
jgi:polyhydroxyalkanoate synthesis regulator phasin